MALDVQISVISATLMTDGETRKSIYFLRPSLCFFRRSRRWRGALGKANDGGLGSIDQATNFSRKTNTRDMRNLGAGRRSRATVTKFIGQSTCPTDAGTCHFLDEHIQTRGHCFLCTCLESPHDRQRTHSFHLVSLQLSCMCTVTKIGDASLRCS